MKRLGCVLAVVFVCLPGTAASAITPGAQLERFVFRGHGLGHGIGLSQWGAEERAAAGQSLTQILSFYYPGTTTAVEPTATVRVLVSVHPSLTIGAHGPFVVRDAAGRVIRLAGLQQLTATSLASRPVVYPLRFASAGSPLRVGGLAYAGTIRVLRSGSQLLAVDHVPLEKYVDGVVSAECPASWRMAALEAQAVAARSYALSHLRPRAAFDVYSDDRSQNYRGLARHFPVALRAVTDTTGLVLEYRGRIADAMFSASNGGLTSAGDRPYLVSRPDPFDARSPAANWGPVSVSAAEIVAAFPELHGGLDSLNVSYDASKRVAAVRLSSTSGATIVVSGAEFQERLGLRSTYLTISAS
jgi:stage II sporulation protein D